MLQIFEESLDESIAEKVGWLSYCPTPWESASNDVQQRRVNFQLSNQISLFGTKVTSIQQKTVKGKGNGHALTVDEDWALHDVPYGENFQVSLSLSFFFFVKFVLAITWSYEVQF